MTGRNGYTLVELIVVVAITVVLAASSAAVFHGYVERARKAELVGTVRQVRQALELYTAEHAGADGMMSFIKMADDLQWEDLSSPKNALYPYVGEITGDCTKFVIECKTSPGDDFFDMRCRMINFKYETKDFSAVCDMEKNTITVTKKTKKPGLFE